MKWQSRRMKVARRAEHVALVEKLDGRTPEVLKLSMKAVLDRMVKLADDIEDKEYQRFRDIELELREIIEELELMPGVPRDAEPEMSESDWLPELTKQEPDPDWPERESKWRKQYSEPMPSGWRCQHCKRSNQAIDDSCIECGQGR